MGLAVFGLGIQWVQAQALRPDAAACTQSWIAAASVGLDARALDTLRRIRGPERQLLALRAYLRAGDTLSSRWSWSQEQLTAYPLSAEGKAVAADIEAVEEIFARDNPGFAARASRMPRSLEVQLEHWNENRTVGAVATDLATSLSGRLKANTASPEQVRAALIDWKPRTAAPLAAPGLSAHGQGRAFDFQIERDGRVVAGFDAVSAHQRWDSSGWTRKLHAAIASSGKPFTGPLQSPYEPWHYAYTPTRAN
jgi:hypothetical protein